MSGETVRAFVAVPLSDGARYTALARAGMSAP